MDNSDLFVDTGDGFGNNGTGGARVALDTEGLGKIHFCLLLFADIPRFLY
jgi:hypothetical protein